VKDHLIEWHAARLSRASGEKLEIVPIAGIEQRCAAVSLTVGSAVNSPSISPYESEPFCIELQGSFEIICANGNVMKSAAD